MTKDELFSKLEGYAILDDEYTTEELTASVKEAITKAKAISDFLIEKSGLIPDPMFSYDGWINLALTKRNLQLKYRYEYMISIFTDGSDTCFLTIVVDPERLIDDQTCLFSDLQQHETLIKTLDLLKNKKQPARWGVRYEA